MLTLLIQNKPWAQDWPESVKKEFKPTLLTDSKNGFSNSVSRVKPIILALRMEASYSRLKIVELLKQLEEWSEKAEYFEYPPTTLGWNRQFQDLCALTAIKGRQSQALPYFIASLYPKAALDALKDFSLDNEFTLSLKNALGEWELGVSPSTTSDNKNVINNANSSMPSVSETKPVNTYQKPQSLEKFQKWMEDLRVGDWDNTTKREWFDGKLKWALKQSNTASEEKWFEQYALPALAAMSVLELDTWMQYWPNRKIILNNPLEMLSSARFWGIMKSASDEVREKLFDQILPTMLRFGSLAQKEKYEVGQEMLKKTTTRADEFMKRVKLWQSLGGDLDAVLPTENNSNNNLFTQTSQTPETFRTWIFEQKIDAWQEGMKQLESNSSRLKM